jgi:Kdo2-lipid IVA lauroyltransferase/acyltransferase
MSQSRWQDVAASGAWTSLILHLPPAGILRAERALGNVVSLLFSGRERRRLERRFSAMLKVAQMDAQPAQTVREFCHDLPLRMNARLLVSRASEAVLGELLRIEGAEHVQRALETGKGAVIVGTHHGTGPIAAAWLARLGHRVLTVRRAELSRYAGTERGDRTFFGTEALFVDRDETPAALLKRGLDALRQNAVISFLCDGDYGSRVLPLTMFGHTTEMRVGMVEVARLAGAPVIPAFGRTDSTGLTLAFHDPIDVRASGGLEHFARKFARIYESVIRADPSSLRWNRFHRKIFLDNTGPDDTHGEFELEDL